MRRAVLALSAAGGLLASLLVLPPPSLAPDPPAAPTPELPATPLPELPVTTTTTTPLPELPVTTTTAPVTTTTAPVTTTTAPVTTTPAPPVTRTTSAPVTRTAPDACAAAIARNRAPRTAGVTERCSGSPVYAWGCTDGTTIWYHPGKIARSGNSAGLWDYVVAHERGHTARYAAGQDWTNERAADDWAARYYPAEARRWSPYR